MFDHSLFKALMLIGIALPIAGCTSSGGLDSIQVTPTTNNLVVGGPTLQLTATGTYGNGAHPTTSNITSEVTWTSAITGVATVNSSGVVTAVGPGTTAITATAAGYAGPVSGSVNVTVTGSSSTEPYVSLSVLPGTDSVALPGQTGQFIALGTTSAGLQVNLTTQVAWSSTNVGIATVGATTGLATAVGQGTTPITAIWTNPDKSVVTASANFTVTGVASEPLLSIAITPNNQSVALPGQTSQMIAIGTFSPTSSTPGTRDLSSTVAWASSNVSVATITKTGGLITAVGQGATVITAEATNPDGSVVTATATFTVTGTTSEPLVSLAIVPSAQTLTTAGQTAGLIAIGTTANGTTVNLTNQSATINGKTILAATWNSTVTSVASINSATGVATAAANGITAITAVASNPDGTVVTGTATLTVNIAVTPEPLVSLAITPSAQTLTAAGQTAGLTAIGTTSSGTTVNLTSKATWSSTVASVATINSATGVATAVANGTTAITAVASNPDGTVVTGTATLTVNIPATPEPLVSLAIVPAAQTLTVANQTTGLIVIGTTSTGTTVNLTNMPATIGTATIKAATWSSSIASVAKIDPASGVATALSNGTTAITAIATNPDGTVVTGIATLTVSIPATPEPVVSLAIVPAAQTLTAANQSAGLIAIGTTGSGTTVNLTSTATWSSTVVSVATINSATGVATAVANGTTAITAIATNPDGTVVTGIATLTVNIPATPEPLQSLAIVPDSQSVAAAGQTTQFLAIGTFLATSSTPGSQNMANVSGYTLKWSSSNPQVATIDPGTGIATAVGPGATAITAVVTNNTDKSGATATATFTVTGASTSTITALSITPGSQEVTLPTIGSALQTVNFVAIGTVGSTGIQSNVTTLVSWSSSNPLVATIDTNGVATALSQGSTTITAIATNKDGSVATTTATLTVLGVASEPLLSLAITPSSQSVLVGQTSQLIAIGTFSSGSATPGTRDMTNLVTWASSNTAVATITPNGGMVTAVGQGTAVITAEAKNPDNSVVTATATFTVSGTATEPLLSLAIVPASQSVAGAGQTAQYLAIGTFSATSSTPGAQNMANISTYTVTWYSSNPSVSTISNTAPNAGVATTVGQGTTAITAIATNKTDGSSSYATATLTVTGPSTQEITSLTIIPSTQTITMPLVAPTTPTTTFVAIGSNSTTGLQLNETNGVTWTSSNTAIATINASGGVTPVSQGTTTITAQYNNPAVGSTPANVVTATATLTVNGVAAEPLLSMALLPGTQSVSYPGQTSQLIAIGTFSAAPVTQNLTNSAAYPLTWSSSNTAVATVCTAGSPAPCTALTNGLVTAVGQGTVAITALAKNADNSVVTGVATITVTNGVAEQITALSIIPSSLALSATGQPGNFIALGTSGSTGLLEDVTDSPQLAWSSSIPAYATIATSPSPNPGQATGVSPGTTNITAEWTNPATGSSSATVVTGTASVAVTTTAAAEPLLSIEVLPNDVTVNDLLGTQQYLAYGTFSTAPTVMDITNGFYHAGFPDASCTADDAAADTTAALAGNALPFPQCSFVPVTWISTSQEDFPIDSSGAPGATGGLITAYGTGTGIGVYALATNPDGTLVNSAAGTGTGVGMASFSCPYVAYVPGVPAIPACPSCTPPTAYVPAVQPVLGSCNEHTIGTGLLVTLTVFNTGLNQSNWLITALSATSTSGGPDAVTVIHCGGTTEQATLGGSVCTATYPVGTPVTLTAPHEAGVAFGGWSWNCENQAPVTEDGPNYCTVYLGAIDPTTGGFSSNVSVGAIFNNINP